MTPDEAVDELTRETERLGLYEWASPRSCEFVPFPGNGAYGHWLCGRRRFHLGRHRFGNYTIGRVPRVWRLRRLRGSLRADRRIRHLNRVSGRPAKPGYGYRQALFPTKYEPVQ